MFDLMCGLKRFLDHLILVISMRSNYIGIDIHKEFSQVCVIDSTGKVVKEGRVDSSREEYIRFFSKYTGSLAVMESTGFWEYLYDAVAECGIKVLLSNPLKTKLIADAKLKTDKVDARTLAHLLRTNMIPLCYVLNKEIRHLRDIVRYRLSLTRDATKIKNRIHHELLRRGIRVKIKFTKQDLLYLQQLNIESINRYLDVFDSIQTMIDSYNRDIDRLFEKYEETKLLETIPGIGKYSALLMFSEIGDISRFGNSKKLASYMGIVPSVRVSANSSHIGHISKCGSRILRWMIVECTHIHVNRCKDSVITRIYNRISKRKGKKKAIIAASRMMSDVIYSVLTNKKEFYIS